MSSSIPTLTLAGLTLAAGASIEWARTRGVRPFITTIDVRPDAHARLRTAPSPTTLVLRVPAPRREDAIGIASSSRSGGDAGGSTDELVVEGVHLVGWSRPDATAVRWTIADRRHAWQRLIRVSGAFNLPNGRNDRDLDSDPARDGSPLPAVRYDRRSLTADGAVWTAVALTRHLVGQHDPGALAEVSPAVPDCAVPDGTRFDNVPLADAIEPLLAMAGVTLVPTASGALAFASLHEDPRAALGVGAGGGSGAGPLAENSGGLAYVDARARRPRAVHVAVGRDQEQWLRYREDDAGAASEGGGSAATPELVNVIYLPFDEQLAVREEGGGGAGASAARSGRAQAGTAWPIADVLATWGLSLDEVRAHAFAGRLENLLLERAAEQAEPPGGGSEVTSAATRTMVARARAAAIRRDFRLTYRIAPALLMGVDDWGLDRPLAPGPPRWRSGASVVALPVCAVPSTRPDGELLAQDAEGVGVVGDNVPVGPWGRVEVLDRAEGVVRVTLGAAGDGGSPEEGVMLLPGHVDGIPPVGLTLEGTGWHGASLADGFSLSLPVRLSVDARTAGSIAEQGGAGAGRLTEVAAAAPDGQGHGSYVVRFATPALGASANLDIGGGAEGPVAVIALPGVRARVGFDSGETAPYEEGATGEQTIANEAIVVALARAAAVAELRREAPRWAGSLVWPGLRTEIDMPGSALEIRYRVDREGRPTTHVDLG